MDKNLRGCKNTLCYLDDTLIAAKSETELDNRVKEVRRILENEGRLINDEKSILKSQEVSWLGYNISELGIKPDKDKAEQIQRLKKPENVKELRQLLGIVNYYQKYIPKMAVIAEPLHSLLRKDKD